MQIGNLRPAKTGKTFPGSFFLHFNFIFIPYIYSPFPKIMPDFSGIGNFMLQGKS